ncbi:C1orf159 isoform 6 [Pongo abelii]|uniref:C1orf159 isoform 6 n=2 Tax=Pongo abelii TaxID=9601 RepID=A0A2J8R781_PONAB|nr:C1orf159 isoform 6 [Pongo abelii]
MALRHLALLAGLLVGVASKSMENMDTDVPAPEVLTRSTVGVRGACASQRGALCCLPGPAARVLCGCGGRQRQLPRRKPVWSRLLQALERGRERQLRPLWERNPPSLQRLRV